VKITQLVPAPAGIRARYRTGDGRGRSFPIVALALTEDGRVVPLDVDELGADPREHDEFERLDLGGTRA
jgi:hypothetical protein